MRKQANRVLLVTSTNLYLTPYIKNYVMVSENSFDILYWDRHYLNEKYDGCVNVYSFSCHGYREDCSKLKKLFQYIRFCSFVKKIVKKYNYQKVIFLQSFVPIFLYNFLRHYLNKKYIVDVRDYTFEGMDFYRRREKKCFTNAHTIFISSEGYKTFLPPQEYVKVHNFSPLPKEVRKEFEGINHSSKAPIKISFIGLIRFNEQNKKIIKFFNNDKRFLLQFIGKGANELKSFVEENKFENVLLVDYFEPSKTLDFYKETDFIMNLYGNNTPLLDYALSNKLYFAGNLYIPILVCDKTYMANVTDKYNIGIALSLNRKEELDDIENFWKTHDKFSFVANCNSFIRDVLKDMKTFEKKVSEFLND